MMTFGSFLLQGMDAATYFFPPLNDLVTYAVPKTDSFLSGARKIEKREDPELDLLISKVDRQSLRNQIDHLARVIGIKRKVIPYCTLEREFRHHGGRWSFTSPVIHIPYILLRRNDYYGVFGKEKHGKDLKKETWLFTDLEMRFLILREMLLLKKNDSFLKTTIRVAVFAMLMTFIKLPGIGWLIALPFFFVLFSLYFIIERITQQSIDVKAVQWLKKTKKVNQAYEVAINCLHKLKRQNLHKRNTTYFGRLMITSEGNDRFLSPSLTKRIEKLEKKWMEEQARPRNNSKPEILHDLFFADNPKPQTEKTGQVGDSSLPR